MFELKKVQGSYLSWHWKGIQNLGRNQLFVSKLTLGTWQVLTWALESLKIFHFNGLFLRKVYIVWAKKSTEELSFITLKRDIKFGEESTCRFKIDLRNLIWPEHSKVSKICTFICSCCAKYFMFDLKKYRGVFFHDTDEWCKIWKKLTCGLENDMMNLANFHQSTWKCQNWDSDGILLSKVENVWA